MRRLANISVTFTTLILLLFGASGITVAKCACSGKAKVPVMEDVGCCPSERGCMEITSIHLSASDLPVHLDAPQLHPFLLPLSEGTAWDMEPTLATRAVGCRHAPLSPPVRSLSFVLRV